MIRHVLPLGFLLTLAFNALAADRVFLGYYSAIGGLEVEQVPFGNLTHVSHAFQAVDESGKLLEAKLVPNKLLAEAAHKHGVKVLLCLGGGRTAEGLSKLTVNDQSLATYVDRIVQLATDADYDGVDIDWETPHDDATRAAFVKLVSLLRTKLDQQAQASGREQRYLLTAVVPPSGRLGKWIDAGAVQGRLDWLNVMAYDMSGPWDRIAMHHAPLLPSPDDPEKEWRSVVGAMQYWRKERGVAQEKLVVGLPMYGRAMPASKWRQELNPKHEKYHGALPFSRIHQLVGKGWDAHWNKQAQAPWLLPTDKRPLIVFYDNQKSIEGKSTWARRQGYRGLYFWTVHQDRMADGTHWLVQAAEKGWPAGP